MRKTAVIHYEENATGLSLTETANFEPSEHGIWVYLNAQGRLDELAKKAVELGGTITTPKTSMGEAGNYVAVKDTEGNIVALWSM